MLTDVKYDQPKGNEKAVLQRWEKLVEGNRIT